MNERIRALMFEAGYAAPELADRAQKLAELLIKECASVAFKHAPSDESACEISAKIEEHFGVE
jgi:hypothetical protein